MFISVSENTSFSTKSSMQKLVNPGNKNLGYVVVIVLFAVYIAIFKGFYQDAGIAVAALATIPAIAAGWYFGCFGGIGMAILVALSNIVILISDGFTPMLLFSSPDTILGSLDLIFVGW